MARADQIKALLKSHLEGDDQRFYAVAMQVAAHEAKLGHAKLAFMGETAAKLRQVFDATSQKLGASPSCVGRA